MQFNYVIASGDTDIEANGKSQWLNAGGLKGYVNDAWLFQYQYKF